MKQKLHYLFTLVSLLAVSTAWSKDFTGGELYTLEEVQYGKFEARIMMAAASGTVSSMFLYQNGSELTDGRPWVEIDIEVLGKNPNSFQSNIITGKAGAQKTSEKHHAVSPAADQTFHTYAIEWTPNYVRWTVDGVQVRKTEIGVNDSQNQVANLTGTQGLRFNLWSSESAAWVGAFDESKLPLFQFINWVKVYRYTPGAGPDGSDFTLDWTDNFNTFDSSRWGKGDWTFDGNRVDLTANNIYCQDGMMILALTRKGEEKFNGSVPVDVMDLTGHEGATGEYWLTFYNQNYNYQVPSTGTQIFKAALNGSTLTLTELTTDKIVTKDNAVILKSTTGPISLTPTSTDSNNDFSGNGLKGVTDPDGMTAADPSTTFVLNNGTNGVGFYRLTPGKKLGVGKAYLTYSGTLAPEFFGFNETTSIESIAKSQKPTANDPYYDLQGRRVVNPTKGLYIVNGNKIVIK